jgi:nucleoside-diphosphate-sugar epimerase
VLINTQMLVAARDVRASATSVRRRRAYAAGRTRPDVEPLKEDDAYPAMPEDGYGWEKLFSERMCRHFLEDFGLETRVARYHNVYGSHGTYEGGREKAPAAICRKIIAAQLEKQNEIEVWGDGQQTRSFMYIDDCIQGTRRLLASDVHEPINIGSDELVTINQLIDIIEEIAGRRFTRRYNLNAPKGVRGRCSDNTLIREKLGWAPEIRLRDGMERTYRWIHDQMSAPAERRRSYA